MKKICVFMAAAVMCAGAMAAEHFGWSNTDTAALTAYIADKASPDWDKAGAEFNLAYVADKTKFDTFEKLVAECNTICEKYKFTAERKKVFVGQAILCRQGWFKAFGAQGYQYCADTYYGINYLFYHVLTGLSNQEVFRMLSNYLIDLDLNAGYVKNGVETMTKIDTRVPKAEKIEIYQLLLEKYYPQVEPDSNKNPVWKPIVNVIRKKLIALGVEVK